MQDAPFLQKHWLPSSSYWRIVPWKSELSVERCNLQRQCVDSYAKRHPHTHGRFRFVDGTCFDGGGLIVSHWAETPVCTCASSQHHLCRVVSAGLFQPDWCTCHFFSYLYTLFNSSNSTTHVAHKTPLLPALRFHARICIHCTAKNFPVLLQAPLCVSPWL